MGEEFLLHAFKSKCEFQVKVNDTVTADIEAGVKKMIEFILQQLKQRCPEFEVADIIPTGSFYEGTKIGAPDEFDFMLTLAKLSVLDKISLHPGCSAWYPHIKLQPEVDFPQHYKVNVRLDGEQSKDKDFLGNPRFVVLDFWKEIQKEMASFNKSSVKFIMPRTKGYMSFEPCDSKKLEFFYISQHCPRIPAFSQR